MRKRQINKREQMQIVSIDQVVPVDHLLRKVDRITDFSFIEELVAGSYSEHQGRPAIEPVQIVKLVIIQHMFGIRSLRQTILDVKVNTAYRWFLGLDFLDKVPHFSTVSFAFAQRFDRDISEKIFAHILELAMENGLVDLSTVSIDSTKIKANANKNKRHKEFAEVAAKVYAKELEEEINADRVAHGKKPFENSEDDASQKEVATREVTKSNTDPDCGMFRKGDHKVEFAYTAHVATDVNGFVLGNVTAPGNAHDSTVFDEIYGEISDFDEANIIAVDAGYKTPWICKRILEDGRLPAMPYTRPKGKKGTYKPNDFEYDAKNNRMLCPNNCVLKYATTNRDGYRIYKSNPKDCIKCPYLIKCTKSANHQRVVTRHIWLDYVELAEAFRHTREGSMAYALRKQTVERLFADGKERHGMRYTPYRGLQRVGNWVTLKLACMNLKKVALWV